MDRNPSFGRDAAFTAGARRVADFLWEMTEGDLSAFPPSYLETLRHEFEDGRISMMEVIDRVDLGEDATYDDYCELVDRLIAVDPEEFPLPEDVVEIQPTQLLHCIEPDLDFSEFENWDFAEEEIVEEAAVVEEGDAPVDPFSEKMELFFRKVIASVYLDGVTDVTDAEGNPPNQANNYLMAPDGKSFSGIFYDQLPNGKMKKFPFTISEGKDESWSIKY